VSFIRKFYEIYMKIADINRYHHLNHYSIFGGGYKGGAVRIMKGLIKKYGKD